MHRASGSSPLPGSRRPSGSRLFATLSRLQTAPPPTDPSANSGLNDRLGSTPPHSDEPITPLNQVVVSVGTVIDRATAVEEWLANWEERGEQIAYRLSLIDGQFEALIRKRELEASAPTPPVRQTVESLSHLFPEV